MEQKEESAVRGPVSDAHPAFLSIGNDLPVVLTTIMPSGLSVMTAIAPRIEED